MVFSRVSKNENNSTLAALKYSMNRLKPMTEFRNIPESELANEEAHLCLIVVSLNMKFACELLRLEMSPSCDLSGQRPGGGTEALRKGRLTHPDMAPSALLSAPPSLFALFCSCLPSFLSQKMDNLVLSQQMLRNKLSSTKNILIYR